MGNCFKSDAPPVPTASSRESKNAAGNSGQIKSATLPDSNESSGGVKHSKIIFMGNANVGKTSIISSFMEGGLQKGKIHKRTDVINDYTRLVNVDEHKVQLNIWDAAGDSSVHNLAHLFMKDARVGVLVYAIDNKKSFD